MKTLGIHIEVISSSVPNLFPFNSSLPFKPKPTTSYLPFSVTLPSVGVVLPSFDVTLLLTLLECFDVTYPRFP